VSKSALFAWQMRNAGVSDLKQNIVSGNSITILHFEAMNGSARLMTMATSPLHQPPPSHFAIASPADACHVPSSPSRRLQLAVGDDKLQIFAHIGRTNNKADAVAYLRSIGAPE
jgi:hypothetical protein